MGDDITIGVTEIVNNIEVTAQPNDQIVEIDVVDNSDDVTLNITPTVIEININKGSSFARWGDVLGNLPDQADLQNVLNLKADLVGGLVPASQLPSYVDDIIEVANYAALPTTGEVGKIYVTLDNNKIFRWSGSVYIEIASDSGYVHIAGDETITGAKTFTATSKFDSNINLSKTGSFSVPSLYNTIGAYNTEFKFGIDSSRIAIVDLASLTAPRIYNYPDKDGIFAMTSDLHSAVTIGTANGLSLSGQELSLALSNATTTGALSSTDWSTFNNKQNALNGTGFVKISGTTISYDNSTYTPTSRTLTINGTSYDLSANRSWTIPTHDAVTIGTPANGLSLSGQILSLSVAHSLNTGALSSTDWTTFNNKIGGSGTINYLPKFTSSGAIGNSNILDNGSYVEILTGAVISGNLNVNGVVSSGTPSNSLSIISNSGAIFVKNSASNTAYAFQLNTSSGLDLWSTNSGGTSTRRMTLDSSGNLGIGTTSPSQKLDILSGTANSDIAQFSGAVQGRGLKISTFSTGTTDAGVLLNAQSTSQSALAFATNGAENMRITSGGDVFIGATSASNVEKLGVTYNSQDRLGFVLNDTYTGAGAAQIAIQFRRNGSAIGSVTTTTTTTSYNITSDYRLKQDFKPFNGLDLVSKIKVYDYAWKADNSRMNGVIAHELQEVVPYAVTGEKDAEQMQSVDYSKLVPILVQAIQELKAEIEILKTK